jgi:hypothetical protein
LTITVSPGANCGHRLADALDFFFFKLLNQVHCISPSFMAAETPASLAPEQDCFAVLVRAVSNDLPA